MRASGAIDHMTPRQTAGEDSAPKSDRNEIKGPAIDSVGAVGLRPAR
jgi:hypothetical protein